MTTREAFLGHIRSEMARARDLRPASVSALPARPAERVEALRRELSERWPATLDRFRAEFERVAGTFHRVATVADVPPLVGQLAREHGGHRVITWHPSALGFDPARGLAAEGLAVDVAPASPAVSAAEEARLREVAAAADLGLTGVELAIAETGSLVVLSGAGRPRSTSLLPPVHVAVLDRDALVESLEQLGLFLEAWHGDGPLAWRGGAINVITGPSRTADIELTLTRGVHGPGEVHGVFVESGLHG